jgi:hypothetical protein
VWIGPNVCWYLSVCSNYCTSRQSIPQNPKKPEEQKWKGTTGIPLSVCVEVSRVFHGNIELDIGRRRFLSLRTRVPSNYSHPPTPTNQRYPRFMCGTFFHLELTNPASCYGGVYQASGLLLSPSASSAGTASMNNAVVPCLSAVDRTMYVRMVAYQVCSFLWEEHTPSSSVCVGNINCNYLPYFFYKYPEIS